MPTRSDDDHEPSIEVIAPKDIRKYTPVPIPGETEAEHKRREELFLAILEAGGY